MTGILPKSLLKSKEKMAIKTVLHKRFAQDDMEESQGQDGVHEIGLVRS